MVYGLYITVDLSSKRSVPVAFSQVAAVAALALLQSMGVTCSLHFCVLGCHDVQKQRQGTSRLSLAPPQVLYNDIHY